MGVKPGFDLFAPIFEEGGQDQFLTQAFRGFIDGKPGTIGGDFEQDAIGNPEVDRAEPEAVDQVG